MLTKRLAVIARDRNNGGLQKPGDFESVDHTAHLRVGVRDFAVVRIAARLLQIQRGLAGAVAGEGTAPDRRVTNSDVNTAV